MTLIEAALPPSQTRRALLLLAAASATLATVWILQWFGYQPCELCLKERIAFYVGVPLAALTAVLASRSAHGLARGGFALLALAFLANARSRRLSCGRRISLVAGANRLHRRADWIRRRQQPHERSQFDQESSIATRSNCASPVSRWRDGT